MNCYHITLSVRVEAESREDAIDTVLSLDVNDLAIETIEEN